MCLGTTPPLYITPQISPSYLLTLRICRFSCHPQVLQETVERSVFGRNADGTKKEMPEVVRGTLEDGVPIIGEWSSDDDSLAVTLCHVWGDCAAAVTTS